MSWYPVPLLESPSVLCLWFSDYDAAGKRRPLRIVPTKPAVPKGRRRSLEGWGGRCQQVGDAVFPSKLGMTQPRGSSPELPRILGTQANS